MGAAAAGAAAAARWLLIGNSRWHWAAPAPEGEGLRLWHTAPAAGGEDGAAGAVEDVRADLRAWAAVGPVPPGAGLPPQRRLELAQVPLAAAPAWLGIDRALAGWQAWRLGRGAVLVADAGTVLSLTLVSAAGAFAGGRLMAGAALQWRAMGAGTQLLPALAPDGSLADPPAWPADTSSAMRAGVLLGLAAAVADAFVAAASEQPGCRLLLTGGDGPALLAALGRRLGSAGLEGRLAHRPALALEALAALAPDQARPRSARI